ncbi:hypothetical protein BDE02_02G177400 [Populus trichocarpa]|nr:hypothetical protein BDE02_02G177400 [Populus trichocarpa]
MARIKPQDLLQQSKKKKAPSRMSVTSIVSYCLILLLTLFFLYSIYKHWSLRSGGHAFVDSKKYDLPGYAVCLLKRGTSRGCLFHRVMKHYVIQAGDGGLLGDTEDWTLRGKHYSQLDTCLKREAFMFGASKTKHDDRGEDVAQEIEENIPRSHAGIIDVTWRQKI